MKVDWYKVSGTFILAWIIVTGFMSFVCINILKSDYQDIQKLSSDLQKLSPIVQRLDGEDRYVRDVVKEMK